MKRTLSLLIAAVASVSIAWSAETAKTTLKIEGMTCGGCVPAVNVQLKKTEGVVAYDVSFERGEAVVSYDPSKTTPAKIAESVTKTGYMASVRTQAAAANGSSNVAAAKAKADPATNAEPPERVTLIQVPLMCPPLNVCVNVPLPFADFGWVLSEPMPLMETVSPFAARATSGHASVARPQMAPAPARNANESESAAAAWLGAITDSARTKAATGASSFFIYLSPSFAERSR